jgi:hypothetical protein
LRDPQAKLYRQSSFVRTAATWLGKPFKQQKRDSTYILFCKRHKEFSLPKFAGWKRRRDEGCRLTFMLALPPHQAIPNISMTDLLVLLVNAQFIAASMDVLS